MTRSLVWLIEKCYYAATWPVRLCYKHADSFWVNIIAGLILAAVFAIVAALWPEAAPEESFGGLTCLPAGGPVSDEACRLINTAHKDDMMRCWGIGRGNRLEVQIEAVAAPKDLSVGDSGKVDLHFHTIRYRATQPSRLDDVRFGDVYSAPEAIRLYLGRVRDLTHCQ
jgi:hypothetical protein